MVDVGGCPFAFLGLDGSILINIEVGSAFEGPVGHDREGVKDGPDLGHPAEV